MPSEDPSDLPQDLTFNDPLVSGRPDFLHISHEPKPEPLGTAMQKIRDFSIGLILLGGFLALLWGFSKLVSTAR
jgi:hypothetical protein